MTKIQHDEILEGLYKLRTRESEKLKTVLELCSIEIHQKTAVPDGHRLKTMVKRSIEHSLRTKNFEARNGNFETSAVVKNRRVKQREQEVQEIVGNGKLTGSVLKETVAVSDTIKISVQKRHRRTLLRMLSCSRMREMRREPEVPEESPSGGMSRLPCKEITSKELAPIHSVKNGILQNACSTRQKIDADLGKVLVCTPSG